MEKFIVILISLFIFTGLPFIFSLLYFLKKNLAFKIINLVFEIVGIFGSLFIPLILSLLLIMLSLGKAKIDVTGLIDVILIGFGTSIVLSIVSFFVDKPFIFYIKWAIYALIIILGTIMFVTAPSEVITSSSTSRAFLTLFLLK